jgi:hypothetical protein
MKEAEEEGAGVRRALRKAGLVGRAWLVGLGWSGLFECLV